jgi:hypothetical protein
MLRSISAILIAVVAWFLIASVGNRVLRAAMRGYTDVEVAMAFTLPMQIGRLALGLVSSLCAGTVCALIARPGSHAAKFFGGIMLAFFLPVHYSLWDKFPVWYHIFFLGTLAPAIILGAAIVQKLWPRTDHSASQ